MFEEVSNIFEKNRFGASGLQDLLDIEKEVAS
jgi:hypothetical protein